MADKSIFPRLKRLFSTDVIVRNEGGNQLRVMDVNSIQQSGEYQSKMLHELLPQAYHSVSCGEKLKRFKNK